MRKSIFTILILVLTLVSCQNKEEKLFKEINAQAAKEYLEPIRPGGVDGSPFWNVFSPKFTYAPAFDFKFIDGAASYRFDLYLVDKVFSNPTLPVPEDRAAAEDDLKFFKEKAEFLTSFNSQNPQAALTPVWGELPVANLGLVVTALDAEGNELGLSGSRQFLKDFPFEGPYAKAPRSYRQAGLMALEYISKEPIIKGFRTMGEDLVMPQEVLDYYYSHFGSQNVPFQIFFLAKFGAAAIKTEVEFAKLDEEHAAEHIAYAKRGAAFMMAQSCPEGTPLSHFPPTFYRNDRDVDIIMSMDPLMVVDAYLNLYEYTKEDIYLNECVKIMETYDRIIDENGYVPKKLYKSSGAGIHDSGALTGNLLLNLQRMKNSYGINQFDNLSRRCEKYLYEYTFPKFDFSGQFEDVRVEIRDYQDLTHCTANEYARYLLKKEGGSKQDMLYAKEALHFIEDQFIHWDLLPNGGALPYSLTPGVYEQYFCAVCIDASNSKTVNLLLDMYDKTGEQIYFEKARALVDSIVWSQNILTGEIPTFWQRDYKSSMFWINCCIYSVETLNRFASYL